MQIIPLNLQRAFSYKNIFNPSLAKTDNGYILICRLQNHKHEGYLGVCYLTNDFQITGDRFIISKPTFIPDTLNVMLEDPRIFIYDGSPYISYVVASSSFWYLIFTVFGKLSQENQVLDNVIIDYKKNLCAYNRIIELGKIDNSITLNYNEWLVEKNWQFFISRTDFYTVYEAGKKHLVVQFNERTGKVIKEFTTHNNNDWQFGRISGGASPVLIDEVFYCFFHSWTVWEKHKKDLDFMKRKYHIGVYTFENKPPFKITSISREPLLSASENDDDYPAGHAVVFPGSALYNGEKDEWIIAFGKNDSTSEILKISGNEIKNSLIPVSEISKYVFLSKKAFKRVQLKMRYILRKLNLSKEYGGY